VGGPGCSQADHNTWLSIGAAPLVEPTVKTYDSEWLSKAWEMMLAYDEGMEWGSLKGHSQKEVRPARDRVHSSHVGDACALWSLGRVIEEYLGSSWFSLGSSRCSWC
jgi:hypothetical protein